MASWLFSHDCCLYGSSLLPLSVPFGDWELLCLPWHLLLSFRDLGKVDIAFCLNRWVLWKDLGFPFHIVNSCEDSSLKFLCWFRTFYWKEDFPLAPYQGFIAVNVKCEFHSRLPKETSQVATRDHEIHENMLKMLKIKNMLNRKYVKNKSEQVSFKYLKKGNNVLLNNISLEKEQVNAFLKLFSRAWFYIKLS